MFFKTIATVFSLEMICQDGLSADRKKVTRYSWVCMLSLEIFILILALPITLSPCENCWWSLILVPHLENVEVGKMISSALSSFKILWCQESGLPISEKSLTLETALCQCLSSLQWKIIRKMVSYCKSWIYLLGTSPLLPYKNQMV